MWSQIKNYKQKGVSLVEVIVSMAVLAILILMFNLGQDQITGQMRIAQEASSFDSLVVAIYQNIREDPSLYRTFHGSVNHPFFSAKEELFDESSNLLNLAWSGSRIVPVDICAPNCPDGRVGFMLRPDDALGRNRYILTIRAINPDAWGDRIETLSLVVNQR